MNSLKESVNGFRKRNYQRVQRNEYSYQQTNTFIKGELIRLLEMYNACLVEDQKARLIRDTIDHHIRRYNGYSIEGKFGAHYRQAGVNESSCIFEHIIPVTNVVAMLIEKRLTIDQALNTPTCYINKKDDVVLRENGLGSSSPDNWNFFKRYKILNSTFNTFNGYAITDLNNWTLEDHYNYFKV